MIQLLLELLITIAVVYSQIRFFKLTLNRITDLANFFPRIKLDESFIEIFESKGEQTLLLNENISSKEDFGSIIISINKYLIKNKGVTDFGIIKSIIERKIESLENAVTANISLPLYIGLMGTFTGIVIGLWNIAFLGGVTDQNINGFLGGVVIAMIGSFSGLLLTVINNSYNLKKGKSLSDQYKNQFYDFLQVELLPHLENSLYDALDRLKLNINDFNKKFEVNIQLFDTKFSGNISSLKDSVGTLSDNMGAVIENTKIQQEFLSELKKIGYNKMADANMRVFKLLNEALPTLLVFIEKQKELTTSVEHASTFVVIIESIMNRVKTFEDSVNNLGESINTKQFMGNEVLKRIDNNLSYLDKQYELLKRHEIDSSERIEDFFTQQYGRIQVLTENIKREVEDALNINIQDNPFQKLLLLESVEDNLKSINEKINFKDEFAIWRENAKNIQSSINEIGKKIEPNKEARSSYIKKEWPENTTNNDFTNGSKSHFKEENTTRENSIQIKETSQIEPTDVIKPFHNPYIPDIPKVHIPIEEVEAVKLSPNPETPPTKKGFFGAFKNIFR